MDKALWFDQFYLENFGLVAAFLVCLGLPLFIFRNSRTHVQASWASVKSWLYILPVLFFFIGLPQPGPFIFMMLISIYSAKRFFQMTGTYHKSLFVYACYLAIAVSGYCIYNHCDILFFSSIFLLLFALTLIPVIMNKTQNMIQYISLTFICFCLFGWNLLFASRIFELEKGVYLLFYLYALAEFAGNTSNGISLMIPSSSVASKVSHKARWSGLICSLILTLALAWAFRRLLFDGSELYWLSAGVIAFFGAHFGEWAISSFRKDLGLKDQGVFIIGRGDLLSRSNRVIYTYPLFTLFLWLNKDLSFLGTF
ncbi:MAG: phosphatidate cytidylyltransferase [Bdellovibrionales bacterium]